MGYSEKLDEGHWKKLSRFVHADETVLGPGTLKRRLVECLIDNWNNYMRIEEIAGVISERKGVTYNRLEEYITRGFVQRAQDEDREYVYGLNHLWPGVVWLSGLIGL